MSRKTAEHRRFVGAVRKLDARDDIIARAVEKTKAAEARADCDRLTTHEARSLESSAAGEALVAQRDRDDCGPLPKDEALGDDATTYDALMDELLGGSS